MEDIFCQTSLCYLTNRCDEGFQLIDLSINSFNNEINLNWEEQEVFCLISMNIIEKRYKSWINLKNLLVKTDNLKKRQSIEIYIETILNELDFYSKKILFLIEKYLFKSSLSSEIQISYLKILGDIHFLLSQIFQSDKQLEHMRLSLHFYDQSLEILSNHSSNEIFLSIIYNKALIFILLTAEYDIAKDILKKGLNSFNEKDIKNPYQLNKIKSLFEQI